MTAAWHIEAVKHAIGRLRKPLKIAQALAARGYEPIGKGAYRFVMQHYRQTSYVIKIFRRRGYWRDNADACGIVPATIKPYWLAPVYVDSRIMIQRHAPADRAFKRAFIRKWRKKNSGNYDIHSGNIGRFRGKPVIIDYHCHAPLPAGFKLRPTHRIRIIADKKP